MLDGTAFPPATAAALKANAALGRLRITNQLGDTDGDGDFDELYAPGARSVSILTAAGERIWDSGDLLEKITAERLPAFFNADHEASTFEARSRSKGPEPEGVVVGRVGPNQYAFVTLERIGGVVVFDVTNPHAPELVDYVNPRDFSVNPLTGATDSGPEGVAFVSDEDSPTGMPLLLVGNEVSKTLAVYEITRRKAGR